MCRLFSLDARFLFVSGFSKGTGRGMEVVGICTSFCHGFYLLAGGFVGAYVACFLSDFFRLLGVFDRNRMPVAALVVYYFLVQ